MKLQSSLFLLLGECVLALPQAPAVPASPPSAPKASGSSWVNWGTLLPISLSIMGGEQLFGGKHWNMTYFK
jgi:hypothetical protein